MIYIQTYSVRGVGRIPMDMLRYDSSFPHREIDASRADNPPNAGAGVEIVLAHVGHKGWLPNEGRWSSFGWNVVETIIEERRFD